jgi:hypothetical protein
MARRLSNDMKNGVDACKSFDCHECKMVVTTSIFFKNRDLRHQKVAQSIVDGSRLADARSEVPI